MINNIYHGLVMGDISIILGLYMLAVTLYGCYIICVIKKVFIYRLKLLLVYLLPGFLSLTLLVPQFHISIDYTILLFCTFITLLHMLYWREIKYLTTSIGYHRKLLVNFLDIVPDMVWMKDKQNRFTYTNEALRTGLLHCTEEEAFGKTGEQLAEMLRSNGSTYSFGEVCDESDNITIEKGKPCRFLEFGQVNNRFLALQIFKAPLYVKDKNGNMKIVGTIGMGRDLTGEFLDHQHISDLLDKGDLKNAKKVFENHINRYIFTGNKIILDKFKQEKLYMNRRSTDHIPPRPVDPEIA